MKKAYIDVETTGLFPWKNGVTQISLIIDIDGECVDRKNWLVKPFPNDIIEQRALEVQGKSEAEVLKYPDPRLVHDELSRTLGKYVDKYNKEDKFLFVAYNSPFDDGFMRKFFRSNNDKFYGSWFWTPDLCVMRLALHFLAEQRILLPNFKLETVAKALGITTDAGSGAHDAETDIEWTYQLHKLCEQYTLRD